MKILLFIALDEGSRFATVRNQPTRLKVVSL